MTIETITHTTDGRVEVTIDELTVIITPSKNTIRIVPGHGRTASPSMIDTNSGILTIEISPRMDN